LTLLKNGRKKWFTIEEFRFIIMYWEKRKRDDLFYRIWNRSYDGFCTFVLAKETRKKLKVRKAVDHDALMLRIALADSLLDYAPTSKFQKKIDEKGDVFNKIV